MKMHDTNTAPMPGPNCASFAPLLPVIQEADIDADDLTGLRAHLTSCAYCQAQLASYERLDAAMRRHLGPAAVPRLSAADILRGFSPESQQAKRALAADTENERAALVIGGHNTHLKDQAPIDLRLFQSERPYAMQNPFSAFRKGGSFLQRLSVIAIVLVLVASLGALTARLVLTLNQGSSTGHGNTSTQPNIYIATGDNWVYKLDAQSHTLQWKKQVPSNSCCAVSGISVVDGVVYGMTGLGTISALNASNGALLWQVTPPNSAFGGNDFTLVMGGGAIYVPGGNDSVYAFSASTGKLLWNTPVAGNSTQAQNSSVLGLAYGDGVLYGSEAQNITQDNMTTPPESAIFALNASTGALLWRTPAPDGQSFGAPQFANGMLFAVSFLNDGTSQPHVSAYNAQTGAQLWRSQPISGYSPLTVVNGTLYVAGTDTTQAGIQSYLDALSTANGALLWRYNSPGELITATISPVVVDGVLYITGNGAAGNFVLALNASTGTTRWHYYRLALDDGSLAVQGDTLYISLTTGILYAISTSDGKEIWHTSYYPPNFEDTNSAKIAVAP
jgi:outer membrane protein assembly factor BamB